MLFVSGAAAVLLSTSAVWGVNVLLQLNEHRRVDAGTDAYDESQFASQPRNVLILGSDSRAGLSPEEQAAFGTEETIGGQRSDTIILMHVDPRRDRAVVVHFPRDLRVVIPGHGLDKINAAYEYGGPRLVVRTVRRFTGLPIHNYVEVNLAGFEGLVDALGGVRICVDRPMHDPLAGLDIPRAGCYTFDGEEALAFVRARHVEGDFIPDFARIARQQQFIRAMLNRLLSVRALLDTRVIEEAVANVTTDERLSGADLVLLGQKLRQLAEEDPSGAGALDFRVVPGTPATVGDVSYVLPDREESDALFRALREGTPLGKVGLTLAQTLPSPGVITVEVLVTPGSDEVASRVARSLRFAGFIVLPNEEAPPSYEESQILFRPAMGQRMQRVLSYFSPDLPRTLVSDSILGEAEVAVVIGDDFERFETVTRP